MSSEPKKIDCHSRPVRGSVGQIDGFVVCRQGHAIHEGG